MNENNLIANDYSFREISQALHHCAYYFNTQEGVDPNKRTSSETMMYKWYKEYQAKILAVLDEKSKVQGAT